MSSSVPGALLRADAQAEGQRKGGMGTGSSGRGGAGGGGGGPCPPSPAIPLVSPPQGGGHRIFFFQRKRLKKNGGEVSYRKVKGKGKKIYEANITLANAFEFTDLDLKGKYFYDSYTSY